MIKATTHTRFRVFTPLNGKTALKEIGKWDVNNTWSAAASISNVFSRLAGVRPHSQTVIQCQPMAVGKFVSYY